MSEQEPMSFAQMSPCCIPATVSLKGQGEEKGSVRQLMEEDSLQSAPAAELCWPRSTLSGDDISKAIKGDDSRQAGSDWQG